MLDFSREQPVHMCVFIVTLDFCAHDGLQPNVQTDYTEENRVRSKVPFCMWGMSSTPGKIVLHLVLEHCTRKVKLSPKMFFCLCGSLVQALLQTEAQKPLYNLPVVAL